MIPPVEISVADIGLIAHRELSKEPTGRTMVGTSRGQFLMLASGWVVYLSPEKYRGPLTLNIPEYPVHIRQLLSGAEVRISKGSLHFPVDGLWVCTDQARLWQPSPPIGAVLATDQRREILGQVEHLAIANQSRPGVQSILLQSGGRQLAGLSGDVSPSILESLTLAYRERRLDRIVEHSQALLGLGPGLTPSGDDLLAGMLLSLNRWGHILAPGLDIPAINREIVPLAYRKTTTLGANLIDCASQGQANERLILALDGIMTGEPGAERCAALLAGWGSSSGVDALAGMSLVTASSG